MQDAIRCRRKLQSMVHSVLTVRSVMQCPDPFYGAGSWIETRWSGTTRSACVRRRKRSRRGCAGPPNCGKLCADPYERTAEAAVDDVAAELLSPEKARRQYGVVVEPETGTADRDATGGCGKRAARRPGPRGVDHQGNPDRLAIVRHEVLRQASRQGHDFRVVTAVGRGPGQAREEPGWDPVPLVPSLSKDAMARDRSFPGGRGSCRRSSRAR